MLSYKEYKLLNESLYGAFNLGLKNPNVVAGVVNSSSINGTEAALEAEAEEAIEEANKMKKKCDGDMDDEDEVEDEKAEDQEDMDDEDSDDEESEEDSEDEESEEDSEDEESDEEDSEEEPKYMKKKAKKEWSEIVADLESFLEDVSEEDSLLEIKKGLELIKEGMKKGKHKKDCDCPFCNKTKEGGKKDKEEGGDEDKEDDKGLSAAQKKLPKALQDAILAKKGKGKGEEKKCGKMMDKKCGKFMNEEEQAWWNSVNSMLGAEPNQKNWDGGWSEVGEVQQAVRENTESK